MRSTHEHIAELEAELPPSASDQEQYKLLRLLESRHNAGQRELASSLGFSLGKANFVLRALISKGLVKAESYRNSTNKIAYLYVLTPTGLKAKVELAVSFLARKEREYEQLRLEIEQLRAERSAS